MADHLLAERLRPSLLDRLTDNAPNERQETRAHRAIDISRLREIIMTAEESAVAQALALIFPVHLLCVFRRTGRFDSFFLPGHRPQAQTSRESWSVWALSVTRMNPCDRPTAMSGFRRATSKRVALPVALPKRGKSSYRNVSNGNVFLKV